MGLDQVSSHDLSVKLQSLDNKWENKEISQVVVIVHLKIMTTMFAYLTVCTV